MRLFQHLHQLESIQQPVITLIVLAVDSICSKHICDTCMSEGCIHNFVQCHAKALVYILSLGLPSLMQKFVALLYALK